MKTLLRSCMLATLILLAACSSGLQSEPPSLNLSVQSTTTLRLPILSASDATEEISGGSVSLAGGLLDLRARKGLLQSVGLRFQKVTIPQGATITSAHLEVKGGGADTGPVVLSVRGEAGNHAATFSTSRYNLSNRSKTNAASTWKPNSWVQGGSYRTGNLAPVVQEIVRRPGWKSGNALALVIDGSSGTGERSAIGYGGKPEHVPVLVVSYKTSASALPPAPTPAPVTPVSPSVPSGNLATWHNRLMATVKTPNYAVALDPKKLAASGDLYKLGRELNLHVTSMILAYRETGDRDIVRHLDQIMNIARNQLGDSNRDSFKNWTYKNKTGDSSTKPYVGTDLIALDEMLTHSMVAAAAYTFKQAGFSSSARFWTDYLENDFEAKWRKRNNKPLGYPFVDHFLMHPTTQFVRYHLYMYKLTGQSSYYSEAKRLAATVRGNMRVSGGGYVWSHRVGQKSVCQPMTYVKYTTQALADMASFDSNLFNANFMRRVADTMSNKVLKNSSGTSLAADACGNGSFGNLNMFAQHPFAQLARWDNSGKLKTATERAYAAFERNAPSPRSANLAATMIFTLGR